ncbi:cyclin-J-like [Saccostrea echinata]|uniref:cyclin-J-like n=1 Tax=Saccostrea echinata TaxID=191078 RepID=UPI002A8181B4|nr:cyclin-J-like [Saccostrea echinata]XP_061170454.1 cyclin-J-like [Saccostrea echinata]
MMEVEWWKNKISGDIYETLRTKEQNLPPYHGHSPQMWFRRHLVDWLAIVVETFYLGSTSQHLAIHLLDFFMDKLEVDQSHLYLLAMACLSISVKFEEHCDRTLRLSSLNQLLPSHSLLDVGYSAPEMMNMEITVLNFFDWSLSIPTVAQFVPYFLVVAVDDCDLIDGLPLSSKTAVKECLERHTKYFMEISLQDHVFRDYAPSLKAASCIAASRISLRLTPTWPQQLQLMTDYFLEELLPCVNVMLRFQKKDRQFSQCMTAVVPQFTMVTNHYPSDNTAGYYGSAHCYPTTYVNSQLMIYPESKPQLSMCRGS